MPVYRHGSTGISAETFAKQWCPPANRKRPIDLVLLSIGGNDIGFARSRCTHRPTMRATWLRSRAWSAARSASDRKYRAPISATSIAHQGGA